jgi:hypothetical protein
MIAPVTVFVAVFCLLLGFAGFAVAVYALIKYAKTREFSLMISAVALILSAIAMLVHALTMLHHFS